MLGAYAGLCARDWWLQPYAGYDPYLTTNRNRGRIVDHSRDGERCHQALNQVPPPVFPAPNRRQNFLDRGESPSACCEPRSRAKLWRPILFSVIVLCTMIGGARARGEAGGGAIRRANYGAGEWTNDSAAPRRALDLPYLCRPFDRARVPIRSIARTWPRGRQGCRSPSTCRPRPDWTATTLLARGEVGKVGVAISHIGDMRTLFEGIPLASMNTSMTINATAPWLMALYIAIADEQGVSRAQLQGTTQNDIIKEYLARGSTSSRPTPRSG